MGLSAIYSLLAFGSPAPEAPITAVAPSVGRAGGRADQQGGRRGDGRRGDDGEDLRVGQELEEQPRLLRRQV